jgi:hypothetical protein
MKIDKTISARRYYRLCVKTNILFILVIEIGTIKISSDTGRLSDIHTDIGTLKRYFYRIGVNVKTVYLKSHNFTSTDTDNIGECENALTVYRFTFTPI